MQALLTGMRLPLQMQHKSTKAWDVRDAVQMLYGFEVVTGWFS
jgi:hypothetical protein